MSRTHHPESVFAGAVFCGECDAIVSTSPNGWVGPDGGRFCPPDDAERYQRVLARKLICHVGHDVEVVTCGDGGDVHNVAAECLTCGETIVGAQLQQARTDTDPEDQS